MSNTKKYISQTHTAVDVANQVTPSVLAIARGTGVKPKQLAEWLGDDRENSLYRAELVKELLSVFVAQAVEQEDKAEAEMNTG